MYKMTIEVIQRQSKTPKTQKYRFILILNKSVSEVTRMALMDRYIKKTIYRQKNLFTYSQKKNITNTKNTAKQTQTKQT